MRTRTLVDQERTTADYAIGFRSLWKETGTGIFLVRRRFYNSLVWAELYDMANDTVPMFVWCLRWYCGVGYKA